MCKRLKTINQVEQEMLFHYLWIHKFNKTEAAKAMGIGRATIYRMINRYSWCPELARLFVKNEGVLTWEN